MEYTKIKNINEYVSESINPMKTPDTVFEMYSVPIYETGHPEYLRGSEIASNKTIVRKNDVLLCKINPRINRVWVVGDESQYQNIASSEWIVIRTSEYNPEFLAWYFRNPKFQKLMMSEVTGIGGSLTRAQPKAVAEYPVPVLPRLEQDAIAEVLNRVNDIINGRKRELQILDDLVKARFVELFGMPGTDDFGWGLVPLGSTCNINPKKSYDSRLVSGVEVSFVPMPAVTERGRIDTTSIKEYDEVKTGFTYFAENDVLFAKITPCMENGKGAVARGLHNGIGFGSTEFHVLRPISGKTNPYWIYTLTTFSQFRIDAANNMTGSAGQRRVPVSFLENYQVSLPPFTLQEQFAAFVTQTDKSKAAVQKALDEAQLLFDSLMQKYFG